MYAIVATGGKQYRVEKGQSLKVERLGEPGSTVELETVMVVDGDTVLATPDELKGTSVTAEVIEESRGKKIDGFTYKSKSNIRRRFGHRQTFATILIKEIGK